MHQIDAQPWIHSVSPGTEKSNKIGLYMIDKVQKTHKN